MTFRSLLRQGSSALLLAEVDTPLLDAIVLLAFAADATKESLLARLPDTVESDTEERYRALLDRRAAGTPVSYLRRCKEFHGLEFYVDERVLVPRPDTETLVERALAILRAEPSLCRVHDACAGSGCVGISLKNAEPRLQVSASDISPRAGEVLAINAERLLADPIPFFLSDLLETVPGEFDLIAANPPYLSEAEIADMRKIGWPEPALALCGGREGTEIAERLIQSTPGKLVDRGWLALEAAPGQFARLAAAMESSGFTDIAVARDLAGRERVIAGRRAVDG
jgi:release factor glutamine methyltransferase